MSPTLVLKKIEEFKYSDGWLAKFKLKFNIKNYHIHGESGDVEVADLTKQRNDLIDLTSQYDIKDIYNMDETALFYRLLPTCTLATEKPEGHKLNKERITLGLCVSASGEILKPIVIGKSAKPRCFKPFNQTSFWYYYY